MIVVLNLFDIVPGREADYAEYLRRVEPILARHGARVLVFGQTRMVHLGQCAQQWCGLIGYPDMAALRALSRDAEFRRIRTIRDEATTNYAMTTIEGYDALTDAIGLLDGEMTSHDSTHEGQPHA